MRDGDGWSGPSHGKGAELCRDGPEDAKAKNDPSGMSNKVISRDFEPISRLDTPGSAELSVGSSVSSPGTLYLSQTALVWYLPYMYRGFTEPDSILHAPTLLCAVTECCAAD